MLSVVFPSAIPLPVAPALPDAMWPAPELFGLPLAIPPAAATPAITCGVDPEEEEDLGDEEDLAVAQPLADEESSFDDFDDEFDDDFEEEENDPDWDHPDEGDEEPPPSKGKK